MSVYIYTLQVSLAVNLPTNDALFIAKTGYQVRQSLMSLT